MNTIYFLIKSLLIITIIGGYCDAAASTKARIESCPGCQLNRLVEVKKFIYEDVPKYSGVEFKKIQGAPPELVILSENDEELERISLKDLNRIQCNELLKSKGFSINKETHEL